MAAISTITTSMVKVAQEAATGKTTMVTTTNMLQAVEVIEGISISRQAAMVAPIKVNQQALGTVAAAPTPKVEGTNRRAATQSEQAGIPATQRSKSSMLVHLRSRLATRRLRMEAASIHKAANTIGNQEVAIMAAITRRRNNEKLMNMLVY